MRKILTLSALAMLAAAPAFAQCGDAEIQPERAWQEIAANTNAHRAAMPAPAARLARSEAAVSFATDAALSEGKRPHRQAAVEDRPFSTVLRIHEGW